MEKGIDSYLKEQFEIPDVDIRTYSPLTLAYIGDGIYDLVIRSLVVAKGNTRASELHKRTSQIVKAHTQAEMMEVLLPILTEEEAAVYKRGRNAKSFTMAKNAIGGGWYKLIVAALIVLVIGVILSAFLNTRLGLSIRATGDNADMVKASSINPSFTITVGLCVANAMTALSGGVLAQYQKSCDINLGTGMVTIALASLIIGESIIGKGSMFRRELGVVLGSCLYRFLVAVALRLNVPAEALKLVSAIIVAIAIAFPFLKKKVAFVRQKSAAQKKLKDNMRLAEANTKEMGGDR